MSSIEITPLYGSVLALYSLRWTAAIIKQRMTHHVSLGDGSQQFLLNYLQVQRNHPNDVAKIKEAGDPFKSKYWPLLVAVRAHGNLIETAPLVLLLAAFAEYNGAVSSTTLHRVLAAFTVGRILHAELGLNVKNVGIGPGAGPGRQIGMAATMGAIVTLSVKLIARYYQRRCQ
ncbi:hypothetical protein H9P43_005496 [Blastocladiella emersonii ATCC 22665]|nr:hypothetical protein H9P43_005496 [Blastocladiella emersonii ATCC 22665]